MHCILLHCPWWPNKETGLLKPRSCYGTPQKSLLMFGNQWICVTKTQSCLCLHLCPVSGITTAAINIKLSCPIWHWLFLPSQPLFSVTTSSPWCPYPVGSMTAGSGLDWRAHLCCSPGSPRAEPKNRHGSLSQNAIFQIFADYNESKSNYSLLQQITQ